MSNLYYSVQVAYREIAKEFLPTNLYSTLTEYRQALEKYLEERAEDFIDTISKHAWIFLFTEKLLPEVCCRFIHNISPNY